MTDTVSEVLLDAQRRLSEQTGGKIDVYYTEGKGALFVPGDSPLEPDSVILAIPEQLLRVQAQMRRFSA
ncbi:hypothetical protein P4H42_03850 [Paenibacillus macerans]|uniref:hypothetical protein n=1 Tax=Paenibacillus macerans TaxID=44252 RepID=UPI002DBF2AE0|nr:hypothetical protein [Paenibacillus macerans]MEC0328757.1 hypothetical protein [Paenibacillus macerans]